MLFICTLSLPGLFVSRAVNVHTYKRVVMGSPQKDVRADICGQSQKPFSPPRLLDNLMTERQRTLVKSKQKPSRVGHFFLLLSCIMRVHPTNAASTIRQLPTIAYRCENSSFPLSASCVTISNPDSLSSSEKKVNPGIKS
jgi:hypothetical protein